MNATMLKSKVSSAGPAWREAEAAGHDMSLIADTLRKPVWERLQMNDSSLELALMLRKAFEEKNGRPSENPGAAR